MTDIDSQVAAFREQLDTIPTTDDQFTKDVHQLTELILAAPSYQRATCLIQEFHAARKQDRDYVGAVVVATVSQVAVSACFEMSHDDMPPQFIKLSAIAHTAGRLGLRAARIIPKVD